MKKPIRLLIPLAAAAVTIAMSPTAAFADGADGTYQTSLDPLNGSSGSGMAMITVQGDQATVELSWSGLPKTFMNADYPHVQHIHIGAQGTCPSGLALDKNGDGIVDTVEGTPAYGDIGTTLSVKGDTSPKAGTNIKIAPGGDSLEYNRTITLSQDTVDQLSSGTGVIVVHGLDPATLSKKAANAKSKLVPSLPLAATAPALCGALDKTPSGGVDTGSGSTAGVENLGMFALGGGLLSVAAVGMMARRRRVEQDA
ncbi:MULTISPECIES: hypothetical protein [unclassified Nocardioides]|uniref:hypothetical protein n=1 Tax=unclassified Nocardioides TaxID=2615069 RepID=UPI0006F55823|nr:MULTISPECIES: hypothetical protein [unclassified Nocardioides]KQY56645.1 hypothetical protein ASD30_10000 [Nocardioides sp. Root140]KRF14478.1 hypothetical protein ASH02_09105 [Nocardioides sp. Soil796]